MEWEEQLDYCKVLFADEYEIDEKTAGSIICDFDLEDAVIERYEEELKEKEEEQAEECEQIKTQFPYSGDIHGGL